MKTFRRLLACALLASFTAHDVAAQSSVTTFSANLPVDFTPIAMAQPDANGYWVAGFAQYQLLLARYRNDGSVALTRAVPGDYERSTLQLAALPDGGVVLGGGDGDHGPCELRRYDAAGTLRWSNTSTGSGDGRCKTFSVDGAGGVWIKTTPIYRLAADGAIEAQVTPNGLTVMTLLGDPTGANAYLIGFDGTPNGTSQAVVERVSEHGDVLWKATPAQAPSSVFSVGATGADGSVYAFGATKPDATHAAVLSVKLDANGQLAWQHTNAPLTSTALAYYLASAAVVGPDGNALAVIADAGASGSSVIKTGAGGELTWSVPAPQGCGLGSHLRAAANGDALLACVPDSSYNVHVLRVSAQGTPVYSRTITSVIAADVQALADSSELALAQHTILLDSNGSPILDANGNPIGSNAVEFDHFGATGAAASAPQIAGIVALGGEVVVSAFGPDGSTYLAVDALDHAHHELARLAADGHVLWRRTLSEGIGNDYYAPVLAVTASRLGLVSESGVDYYAIADGASLGTTPFSDNGGQGPPTQGPIARVLDDGALMVFYDGDTEHQVLLSANGNVLHDAAASYTSRIGNINGSGAGLFASDPNFLRVARDGTSQYIPLPATSGEIQRAYLADDGSALLFGTTSDASILTRIAADNTTLWTHTIAAPAPAPDERYNSASGFVVRGDYAYLVLGRDYGTEATPLMFTYTVGKVALGDGSVVWSAPFASDGSAFPFVLPDASGQRLLIVAGSPPDRIRTQVLNAANGAIVDDRMDDCNADSCGLVAAAIGGDGALRAVLGAANGNDGHVQRVLSRAAPFDATPIRVDQDGIAGAWYASYESGQGFTLDYIANAKTIFMPWFTYSLDEGNTPAGLTWYTLQGTVADSASSADLAIGAVDPGAFNSGAVGIHQVGSAQLRFSDCMNGTLSYRFDAGVNNGAAGQISLTRLTPSSSSCILANGSITPAQAANAPAQGFDTRQSGSWFDPSTSGQGVEITVLPAGNGSNGLLFAAWFTFDPAGSSDEDTHRHWFTLQGDLAQASSGRATVSILRTIGGSFDGTPTGNTVRVGQATLTFSACDRAQLDYQFDASDVAHAFSGLSGSINLVKINGCSAP